MGHVAHGVDVNQEAYAGHDQHHHCGKLVEVEAEWGLEGAGPDPWERQLLNVRER